MASSKERKGKKPRQKKMKGNILEQIKDVYFKDLPNWLQSDLMEIHKIIVQGCHDEWQKPFYDDLRKSDWAKSMYDEFIEMPMGKRNTGSARLYKKKNRYSCMIQITGHVPNNREDIQHEEFHEFIRAVHISLKAKIRRKYDMALVCESEHGEHFEGFDVWPKQKVAKELWEQYPDVRVIEDKPHTEEEVTESATEFTHPKTYVLEMGNLPIGLQSGLLSIQEAAKRELSRNISEEVQQMQVYGDFLEGVTKQTPEVGYTEITESNGQFTGQILVSAPLKLKASLKPYVEEITKVLTETTQRLNTALGDGTKHLEFTENRFVCTLTSEYAEKLLDYSHDQSSCMVERRDLLGNQSEFFYCEADTTEESSNPRATLDSLAESLLKSQSVTPAVANTIATLITTHFLKEWAPGYTKFNIVLSKANTGNTLELKIPTMTRDFIGRFVESRESVEGFLHQNPTITVRMSSGIFRTMKNKSDLYNFFRSMIKYYADGLPRCALRLQSAIGTLHRKQKFQLTQSTLRGLVVLPFKMLTVFDDVDMSKKNFNVTAKEITSVCKYITNIAQNHSSDDKNSILDGLRSVIHAFNESTEFDENLKAIRAAFTYLEKGLTESDAWEKHNGIWQDQQVDLQETYHHPDPEVAYLQEANRVKKLKKLPRDLVAYITIETESIEDANDKMMIASYCLGKLDIVEWYIELIDTANPRYIVPHPRPYLVTLRTELLECYKNIMATKIPDKKNRPYLDIQYPAGLEG